MVAAEVSAEMKFGEMGGKNWLSPALKVEDTEKTACLRNPLEMEFYINLLHIQLFTVIFT